MRGSLLLAPFISALAWALPQAAPSCVTTTVELIVPTSTYTFLSTVVVTSAATIAKDLGTFTHIVKQSATTTITTLTTTSALCGATTDGTITVPATETIYTPSTSAHATAATSKRGLIRGRQSAQACTITSTLTTTYGVTETYLPANKTSTHTAYTAFTQETTSTTSTGGATYTIATATATTSSALCGPTLTSNATQDATQLLASHCAPSAQTAAASGYGLGTISTPSPGAEYVSSTRDAAACCQLCADSASCAASAWDVRSAQCRIVFTRDAGSGAATCAVGYYAFYDYGPERPLAPGAGWWVQGGCGAVEVFAAAPDDGS